MDTVSGRVAMEKATLVSGSNPRLRAMVCTCSPTGTSMKESGTPVSEKAMALISLQMVTAT